MDMLEVRGNQSICRSNINAYSGISNQWKTNPHLHKWFNALGKQGQAMWYRNKQVGQPGKKREYGEVTGNTTSSSHAVASDLSHDDWVPLNIYIRRLGQEGLARNIAIRRVVDIVQSGHGIMKRGLWHVHDYTGFTLQSGTQNLQGFEVQSSKRLNTRNEMRAFLTQAQEQLTEQQQNQSIAMRQMNPANEMQVPDAPHMPSDAGPQLILPRAANKMLSDATAEVDGHWARERNQFSVIRIENKKTEKTDSIQTQYRL